MRVLLIDANSADPTLSRLIGEPVAGSKLCRSADHRPAPRPVVPVARPRTTRRAAAGRAAAALADELGHICAGFDLTVVDAGLLRSERNAAASDRGRASDPVPCPRLRHLAGRGRCRRLGPAADGQRQTLRGGSDHDQRRSTREAVRPAAAAISDPSSLAQCSRNKRIVMSEAIFTSWDAKHESLVGHATRSGSQHRLHTSSAVQRRDAGRADRALSSQALQHRPGRRTQCAKRLGARAISAAFRARR